MPILNKIISEYNIDIYYLDYDSFSNEGQKTSENYISFLKKNKIIN